jgi:hypothetical protein
MSKDSIDIDDEEVPVFYFDDFEVFKQSSESLLSKSIITESDEPDFTTIGDCFMEVDEGLRANQIRSSIKESNCLDLIGS